MSQVKTDKRQGKRHNKPRAPQEASEFMEKVVKINRVTKVNKGGKRLGFRALVIVGDQKGKVGIGLGKAKEVPIAIKKAIDRAKKSLQTVRIIEGTVPHEILGKHGSVRVKIRPAKPGTGVIAGGAVRTLLEAAGFKNVVAKSHGSNNAINNARATLEGLLKLKDLNEESELRGFKLPVHVNRLESSTEESERRKPQIVHA